MIGKKININVPMPDFYSDIFIISYIYNELAPEDRLAFEIELVKNRELKSKYHHYLRTVHLLDLGVDSPDNDMVNKLMDYSHSKSGLTAATF